MDEEKRAKDAQDDLDLMFPHVEEPPTPPPAPSRSSRPTVDRDITHSPRSGDQLPVNPHTWILFQDAAASTSKLYQARASGREGHWQNFQNAASSISMLYKESLDGQQRFYDSGYRAGVEKAYNELMEWLVQDPRYHPRKSIRAEDLIKFIYSPKNSAAFGAKIRAARSMERNFPADILSLPEHQVRDLETFTDALHVSSLNGAMSHFSVDRSPPRHQHSGSPSRTRPVDLHAFVTEEFRRHKRSTSSAFELDERDFGDGDQSYKRSRYSPPK